MKTAEALGLGIGVLALAGGTYWLATREVEAEEVPPEEVPPEEEEVLGGRSDFSVTIG